MQKARRIVRAYDDSETTVKEVLNNFILEKQADGRSEKTIESYQGSIKKFLDAFDRELKVKDINKDTIVQYKNKLQDDDNLSLASINHYIRDLKAFLSWGNKALYFPKIQLSLIKGQEAIKEVYSTEELDKLLEKPKRKLNFVEWRTWAIINWILGTGNRIDTIVNVKIGDVHFSQFKIMRGLKIRDVEAGERQRKKTNNTIRLSRINI